MTEVPDHLLQRSRARRRALGLPVGDEVDPELGDPGAAGATEAAVASGPSPTVLAPISPRADESQPPPPTYVTAARARKKPPLWVGSLFVLLPVYLLVYVALLGEEAADTETALGVGAEIYAAQCATCHLGDGAGRDAGGSGQTLYRGEVIATFPDLADQFAYVRSGSLPAGEPYGDPERQGGGRISISGMPPSLSLTDAELYAVVRHEREVLSGEELDEETLLERDEHFEQLLERDEINPVLPALEVGDG